MKNDLYKYLNQYKDLYGKELIINSTGSILNNKNDSNQFDYYISSIKDTAIYLLTELNNKFILANKNLNSKIIFIGEGLNKTDDIQGLPFIGESGKLFDRMLKAIHLTRDNIYILNILEKKTFKNMNFLSDEIKNCNKYLVNELKIIKPRLIVALGELAAMTLLQTKENFNNLRKKDYKYGNIDFLVTYHPAELLINSKLKKNAWQDFKKIRNYM